MVDEIKVLRIQTLWLIYVNDMKHFLFTFFIFYFFLFPFLSNFFLRSFNFWRVLCCFLNVNSTPLKYINEKEVSLTSNVLFFALGKLMATRKIFKRWKSSMFSSVSPWLILFLEFTRGKLDYESNVVTLSPFVFNQHRTVSRKYPLHDYLLATVVVYSVNTQEFGDIALMFFNLFSLFL